MPSRTDSSSSAPSNDDAGPAPKLRVAVVEDAENIRQRLVQLVEESGGMLVVGEADNEEQAIDVCRDAEPDAIVLDMQLARGSGLGVLKAMNYAEGATRPAVIVLTNFPSPAVERAARGLGAEWFLDKSSEFHKLPQLLQLVSDRRQAAAA